MNGLKFLKAALIGGAAAVMTTSADARQFDIPGGDLSSALSEYSSLTGVQLIYAEAAISGIRTRGVKGDLSADAALSRILSGTDFVPYRHSANVIGIARQEKAAKQAQVLADAAPSHAAASVETVVVTSSKIKGDIQTVPIAITALSQEQLTSRQIAGGPDLVKEVPNLTFSKTNFTGYNIEIRGIGTQAISVTTDPAVAVAFNDTPFIRNHFFEQEFYDVAQVEVLRGPQGTLYGRNATAGVVNVVSAKPTDQFEAMLSADWGNYSNRRYEGMVNLPIVGDKLALRIAGEWTKRDGYSFNETTNQSIDGRDLWSTRATLRWHPVESVTADLIWEHFSENDDRLRSGKQLCKTDPGHDSILGVTIPSPNNAFDLPFTLTSAQFSQGCLPASLYSPEAFQVPNGFSLPFISGADFEGFINTSKDPYAETTQSTDLRKIQSAIEPKYLAKNDTVELNASWNVTPALTFYSDSGYNDDFLWSTEDYNRYDTSAGIFIPNTPTNGVHLIDANGFFCDPQLGCSNRLVVQDLSTERAWQFSQEFRLASNFNGPLNFSIGANYLHYETVEKYYVFSNTFTLLSTNNVCLKPGGGIGHTTPDNTYMCLFNGKSYRNPYLGGGIPTESSQYVDPNPITSLTDDGHNYFLSKNPYVLNSYAGFGEAYYNVTPDLKLTAGLRWTDDEKHFIEYPSQVIAIGYGYPSTGVADQNWNKWTGRFVANWSPKLDFTDQSMFYASYARGYKAGGANPPGAVLLQYTDTITFPVHPLTFKPEFIDAFELGTKNTLLDGGLTLNGDVFFYNYKGYQISQIVDRTSVNLNFDATVKGAEIEATWEPLPGLKFAASGGYEDTNIGKSQSAIDLMDRTAGTPHWLVMKPWAGQSSNCIIPDYVAAALIVQYTGYGQGNPATQVCGIAYNAGLDPVTEAPYSSGTYPMTLTRSGYPTIIYPGFDPLTVDPTAPANVNNGLGLPPNNGEGFAKSVAGNELPNAPHFTTSFTADYTMPLSANWAATLHGDFYWQSQSWARVFNDRPYDKIRGYSNVNLALILTDAWGWQVMGYVKNIFDTTAITGDFLNSDDSGLTTNVFLTDPRLYGIRVTKHFDGGSDGMSDLFGTADGERPLFWLQLGGNYALLDDGSEQFKPSFNALLKSDGLPTAGDMEHAPKGSFDWEGKLSYQPEDSDWVATAKIRYGRSSSNKFLHKSLAHETKSYFIFFGTHKRPCNGATFCSIAHYAEFVDSHNAESETHTILDFSLGKDIGIGSLGKATISGGVRVAQFDSKAKERLNSDPNYVWRASLFNKYHDVYNVTQEEKRGFHGVGPELSWDASTALSGNATDGQIALDWGVNAGMLFGRQNMVIYNQAQETKHGFSAFQYPSVIYSTNRPPVRRSRNVAVPNLGGYAGLSVKYNDAKISFGYRADEFFNAMDGGQNKAKNYNRGFYGPYLNLSIGFGG